MKNYLLSVVLAALVGCSADVAAPLVASNIIVTPPRPGASMSAGYLRIQNNSRATIVLTSVTSPQYGRVEIHETVIENDIARMRPLDGLTIYAGQSVLLEPGGKHLMLMGPREPLTKGEKVDMTLTFKSGRQQTVSVQVAAR